MPTGTKTIGGSPQRSDSTVKMTPENRSKALGLLSIGGAGIKEETDLVKALVRDAIDKGRNRGIFSALTEAARLTPLETEDLAFEGPLTAETTRSWRV